MATVVTTLWGSIHSDGTIKSSGGGFSVSRQGTGQYVISFRTQFVNIPSMVATQTNWGKLDERTTDGAVIPFLDSGEATVLTGNSDGTHDDRSFSFIAIGNTAS